MRAAPPLLAALAVCLLGLWACRSPAKSTPIPLPAVTAPVATTVPETAVVTRKPPEPEPAWTVHQEEAFSIRLPVKWQAGKPDAETGAARLSAFQRDNPELAGFLGEPGLHGNVVFSAQDASGPGASFADNLNIRRTALDGKGGGMLPEIADTVAAQYRQLGFDVLETSVGAEIGGAPSARISYALQAASGGGRQSLSGLQVLVATPDVLWVLTYTTEYDRFAALRPIFEESARSFRIN